MISRKLAQRTNAWLIRVDFFYKYSWVNGLCFGYFHFFLSALRSIRNYVYVLTFAPCGIHTNMEILLHTYNIITRIRDFVLRLEQTRTNTGKNIIFRRYCSLQKEARK